VKVWKYLLKVEDVQSIDMPIGGQILDLQLQENNPCLWVLVIEQNPLESRIFRSYNTGEHIGCSGTYIGTYQYFHYINDDSNEQEEKQILSRKTYHVFEVLNVRRKKRLDD
jgi:hypothetical protein